MAESHFRPISPDQALPNFKRIDWNDCFICQLPDNDSLVSPSKRRGKPFVFILLASLSYKQNFKQQEYPNQCFHF